MAGDLHLHTTHSDGSMHIEQLVEYAQKTDLTHIAISDHDTILSAQYSIKHKKAGNLNLIPAIEMSCIDPDTDRKVHILCYYPNITQRIIKFCDDVQKSRNKVAQQCLPMLQQKFPLINWSNVTQYSQRSGTTFNAHFMAMLVEHGYTDKIYGKLFDELFLEINDGKITSLYNPEFETVYTTLDIIKQAGGVCVLAPPSFFDSMELCEKLAKQSLLDGIELYHVRNSPSDRQFLSDVANKYNLFVTGGTDFHARFASKPYPIGTNTTDESVIEHIKNLADKRKSNL